MEDLIGTTWGRFQIIKERGRGGMAVVYKAYDGVLQRTVALKVLLPLLAANQEFTWRFRREAITAANLRHPNIVVIYDVGSYQNFQYIVMEYVEGPTLQREIRTKGAMPLSRTISIVRQLALALDYAHRQGLVHRDVKPANVMLGRGDHVTLTDFGLVKAAKGSKITGEGAAIGTLKYMSPEQAAGAEINSRSDIYSLGVVVYEMLAGEAPFSGPTPYQTLNALMHKAPPPLSRHPGRVSPEIERIVFRALAKEPERRFGTAGEFASALTERGGQGKVKAILGDTDAMEREISLLLISPDGREFPLYCGTVTIGRDTVNDVIIPDRQVSRRHAQVRCEDEGCTVVDLGSTNGTSVNGVPIPPRQPQPLAPGDVLGLGPVMLLAAQPSRPAPSGSSTAIMEFGPGRGPTKNQ